jgi:uncharacterized membrane protein YgcG
MHAHVDIYIYTRHVTVAERKLHSPHSYICLHVRTIHTAAVLLAAWCTYNIFLRVTASSIFGSIRSSQSGTSSSRWSGGGGRAWGARASGSGGSNIRGIVDLPCDPVRG